MIEWVRTSDTSSGRLCPTFMGTSLGPKVVTDAKASLANRNLEGELTSMLDNAFKALPASYNDMVGSDAPDIKTWCHGLWLRLRLFDFLCYTYKKFSLLYFTWILVWQIRCDNILEAYSVFAKHRADKARLKTYGHDANSELSQKLSQSVWLIVTHSMIADVTCWHLRMVWLSRL